MATLTQQATASDLTSRIVRAWRQRLRGFEPEVSAATCLFGLRLRCGRLFAGGIGDGLAAVAVRHSDDQLQVISLEGGDFGATVALGDGLGSSGWVVKEFDDRDASHRLILASDGVSNDLRADRLGSLIHRLIVEFRGDSSRKANMGLRRMLQSWPTPGANDDRTLALMWHDGGRTT